MSVKSLFALLALCVASATYASDRPETLFRGPALGTVWNVILPEVIELEDANEIQGVIQQSLDNTTALMSTWEPDSTLSQFNSETSGDFVELGAEITEVLQVAKQVSEATEGAYDVTLGEVLSLYGVGSDNQGADALTAEERKASVAAALARARQGELEQREQAWRKPDPSVRIDVSSVAKGYAVDQVGKALEAIGRNAYIVEIGGEVRTRGLAGDGEPWAVGIETPDGYAKEGLVVENAHVATSGSYRNWRELDGERVSHVIDGRNGQPITHDLVSVTVLAESTAHADAWATALLVLGPEAARKKAQEQGLEVQLVTRDGDDFDIWRSDKFASYLKP